FRTWQRAGSLRQGASGYFFRFTYESLLLSFLPPMTSQRSRRVSRLLASVFLWSFGGASFVSAVTLDWSTVTWTAGTTSNSYDIDPSNPGNDITISMTSSSGNQFATGFPAIATGFGGTTNPALRERVQLTSSTAFVTTTINFNY